MDRTFTSIGASLGFLGVALGAFAAHGLKAKLTPEQLAWFDTGVRYHLLHAPVVLLVGLLAARAATSAVRVAGWTFTGGVVLFSGSLYVMAVTDARWLGAVTPIGGVLLLAGWAALFVAARRPRSPPPVR